MQQQKQNNNSDDDDDDETLSTHSLDTFINLCSFLLIFLLQKNKKKIVMVGQNLKAHAFIVKKFKN